MKKRILALIVSALLALSAFAGCSSDAAETSQAESAAPVSEAEASETEESAAEEESAEAAAGEVSITDVVGRTVTLEQPATKVVGTHNPTMNQLIILGGGGKYIAGFGNKNMAGGLYEYVYPELANDVPQIGMAKEINMESVLGVGADLAVLPERHKDLVEQFDAVGIPSAVVLPNNESFDTIRDSLRRVAALVGEEERAEQILAFFDAKVAKAQELAQQGANHPKVLYLGGSSKLSVANGVMLQSSMIEAVGATNVAKDVDGAGDFIDVTIEEIVGWNPEVIYIPTFAQYTVDDILNDDAWANIQAVKDKKVYVFPSELEPWDYPTPSTSMGLSWLMHNIHPELYTLDDVLNDANEYYDMVYGQTFTAEQLGLTE